jgi:hypothetical protein
LKAFHEKRLDYVLYRNPFEDWGSHRNVINTVSIHNDIVRRLASKWENILFVDQEQIMKGAPGVFNDPVHLTVKGSLTYVENLLNEVLSVVESNKRSGNSNNQDNALESDSNKH